MKQAIFSEIEEGNYQGLIFTSNTPKSISPLADVPAKKGLTIPNDIAVMGYDNQLLASELTPSLSSIDLPYDEMGRKAVEMICKVPMEEALPLIKIEGELYDREST